MKNQDPEQQTDTAMIGHLGKDVLQDQLKKSFEPRPCSFSTLPVELQMHIFMVVIGTNESKLIALTSVCRIWRTIILNTPTFWRYLTISKKTTQEKVDTWLQRAGRTFSSLLFKRGFDFDTLSGLFGSASANIWSSLEHLEIQSDVPLATLLPPTAYKELRLRSLILAINRPSPGFWDDLWKIDVSCMRNFQVHTGSVRIPIAGSRFTGLVTLRLHGAVEESALLDVIEHNPLLETLGLSEIMRREPGSSRRVELNNLTYLECRAWAYVDDVLQCLSFPNLKTLSLHHCTLRSSEALLSSTFVHLEELTLAVCDIPSSALITLLRNACAIKHLEFIYNNATNSVFEALASPIPGELEETPRVLCCPRLQNVHLINVLELRMKSVMALVKARLPNIGGASALEESTAKPLPIRCLKLINCRVVDHDNLHWFEANVPEFVYRN